MSDLVKQLLIDRASVGVVTALPKEHAAVEAMLQNRREHSFGVRGAARRYVLGQIPLKDGGSRSVVLAMCTGAGNNLATVRAAMVLEHFPNVEHLVMCGIAGGVPRPDRADRHVRFGDVVISDHKGIIQVDLVARIDTEIQHRNPPRPPSAALLETARYLEARRIAGEFPWEQHISRAAHLEASIRPREDVDAQGNIYLHPIDLSRRIGQPRVMFGTIGSSNTLLRSEEHRDEMVKRFDLTAFEMEGSGIADAAWELERSGYLVIRGISDYCDPNKGDVWQQYASIAAASYFRALVESLPRRVEDAALPQVTDGHQNGQLTRSAPSPDPCRSCLALLPLTTESNVWLLDAISSSIGETRPELKVVTFKDLQYESDWLAVLQTFVRTSPVVIADISGSDPFVLYWLARRQEVGKMAVILAEHGPGIPMYIDRPQDVVYYEPGDRKFGTLNKCLARRVQVLSPHVVSESAMSIPMAVVEALRARGPRAMFHARRALGRTSQSDSDSHDLLTIMLARLEGDRSLPSTIGRMHVRHSLQPLLEVELALHYYSIGEFEQAQIVAERMKSDTIVGSTCCIIAAACALANGDTLIAQEIILNSPPDPTTTTDLRLRVGSLLQKGIVLLALGHAAEAERCLDAVRNHEVANRIQGHNGVGRGRMAPGTADRRFYPLIEATIVHDAKLITLLFSPTFRCVDEGTTQAERKKGRERRAKLASWLKEWWRELHQMPGIAGYVQSNVKVMLANPNVFESIIRLANGEGKNGKWTLIPEAEDLRGRLESYWTASTGRPDVRAKTKTEVDDHADDMI